MNGDNLIYRYYQQICDGTVIVGKWIKLVYEYLIKGLENKLFFFDQKRATAALDWLDKHSYHVEGALAPGRIEWELWQKAFWSAIFGIVDSEGHRQFREVVLVVARKNGKSLMAGATGNHAFRAAGEYGARVYCVAPKLDQADIVYNDIWQMITLDPEYKAMQEALAERDEHNRRVNTDVIEQIPKHTRTDIKISGTNSSVKKVPFSARRSDGFNPSLCICDEVAAWAGDAGLKQYEVLRSGMGARPDGMLISLTTSGYINDGIYDELIKRSTRFLMGESSETRLLPFLYMIDDIEKWNDINELRKSNPNLGVSVSVDYMLEEIRIAEGSLSKRSEFLTKNACVKQSSSLAWLPAQVVEKARGDALRLEDFRNSYAVGGIDLSQTRDLTACCAVIEKDGELYVFSKFFLPAEKIDEATERDGVPYGIFIQRGILQPSGDNFVDYHDCFNWFRSLVEDYEIYPLQVGYDRYSAQYLVQDMQSYGFHMDDVFQGENLYGVIQETQGLLEDGKIHIGDNDLLASHLLNSAVKLSTERGRGKLIKIQPSLHIDGTAALLDAMTVRQKWYSEIGEQLANTE